MKFHRCEKGGIGMGEKRIVESDEQIILSGLVVDWTLPSRSALVDWISQNVEDVRVKELVELFPKEVFDELENLRRIFYYRLQDLTIPAFGLRILPMSSLPKFQKVVELTKQALEQLDEKIREALKSEYTQKAIEYYIRMAESKPRLVDGISKRFTVALIPLRIDKLFWDEFLNEQMQREMARIREQYDKEKKKLEEQLDSIRQELELSSKRLEGARRDLADAEAEVEKAYEGVKAPVDVALLRVEKSELENKVRELRAKATDLQHKIQQLEREQRERESGVTSARVWAGQQTEETSRRLTFDAYAILTQQLRDLIDDVLRVLEEKTAPAKELERLKTVAQQAMERARSLMPGSTLANTYETVYVSITDALQGNVENATSQLEQIRREL
jgi:hypothetical protein